jgi:hypothetical protein
MTVCVKIIWTEKRYVVFIESHQGIITQVGPPFLLSRLSPELVFLGDIL